METISITFGECAENNIGMQLIGKKAIESLSVYDFQNVISKFGNACEIHDLSFDGKVAHFCIIRNGVNLFGEDKDKIFEELLKLPYDKQMLFRGKVVNKIPRWNSCFSDFSQDPHIIEGKGTVIDFRNSPLSGLRDKISLFGSKANKLNAELNYYYDVNKCGIGWHIDNERKVVICARFGASMLMSFSWFGKLNPTEKTKAIGPKFDFVLNHGDIYAMTDSGHYIGKNKVHLRHAAGCKKYTDIQKKHK